MSRDWVSLSLSPSAVAAHLKMDGMSSREKEGRERRQGAHGFKVDGPRCRWRESSSSSSSSNAAPHHHHHHSSAGRMEKERNKVVVVVFMHFIAREKERERERETEGEKKD